MSGRPSANPFQPGRGVAPPVLAGRDEELGLAGARLEVLRSGVPPSRDLLFYGPRGNGKTVLAWSIAQRARERGLRVESLPVSEFADKPSLIRELQGRAGEARRRIRDVRVAGAGVGTEPALRVENVGALLACWARRGAPLVIVLDEVHAVGVEAGRAWSDALQDAKREGVPFLLLAAGTPDAPRRLREMATYNERGFEPIPVGRLRRRDTEAALGAPAEAAGLAMTAAARRLLAAESVDYPFFIQLLGHAAWDAALGRGEGKITLRASRAAVARARREIEAFYGARFGEARERRVHRALFPLAARVRERGGELRDDELEDLLDRLAAEGAVSGDGVSLLNTLRDLGVVWETEVGVWEMGIPSFADHVIRRHEAASGRS